MTTRRVLVPTFEHHKVDGAEHTLTPEQVFVRNMEALYQSADTAFNTPTDNAIYIFVREKMANGEFRYGCAALPTEHDEYLTVEIPGCKKLPPIFINVKEEIIKVVKRVKNNLTFI